MQARPPNQLFNSLHVPSKCKGEILSVSSKIQRATYKMLRINFSIPEPATSQ